MNARVERYHHAVAQKSRAWEYRRTATWYCDIHWAINRLRYWGREVEAAFADLPPLRGAR